MCWAIIVPPKAKEGPWMWLMDAGLGIIRAVFYHRTILNGSRKSSRWCFKQLLRSSRRKIRAEQRKYQKGEGDKWMLCQVEGNQWMGAKASQIHSHWFHRVRHGNQPTVVLPFLVKEDPSGASASDLVIPSTGWWTVSNLHRFETVWIRRQEVMSGVNEVSEPWDVSVGRFTLDR